jgi:ABC-type phosphate transport system substrate-binding protein
MTSKFRKAALSSLLLTSLCSFVHADIVVVTSAKNQQDELSKSMVKKIFLKKITEFPNGQSVEPIDFVDDNMVKWDFYKEVTRKKPAQIHSYWSRAIFTGIDKPPTQVQNSRQLKALLSKNPNLIGYMDEKDIDTSLKVLFRIES